MEGYARRVRRIAILAFAVAALGTGAAVRRRHTDRYVAPHHVLGGQLESGREHHLDTPLQSAPWVAAAAGSRVSTTCYRRREAVRPDSGEHRLHRDLRRSTDGASGRNRPGKASLGDVHAHQRMPHRPLEPALAVAPAARRRHELAVSPARDVVSIDAREDRPLRGRRTPSATRDRAGSHARTPCRRGRQELRGAGPSRCRRS